MDSADTIVVMEEFEQEFHPRQISPVKDFIAGGFGGSWLVLIGHPMDTIKVKINSWSNKVLFIESQY